MLLAECAAVGVDVRVAHTITAIEKADRFAVHTDHGDFDAGAVVLATGGLSIPKMGATGFAHETARRFGLRITQTRPALVPLTREGAGTERRGARGRGALRQACFREAMLFTHRGLSGPAILQISSYWKPGQEIAVDLLPDQDAAQFLKERKRHARPKAELRTILAEVMPQRLAQAWCSRRDGERATDLETTARAEGWSADRHRRLRQGGSHARRHRHRRAVLAARWKRARCPACS